MTLEESGTIAALIRGLKEFTTRLRISCEVIVVDGGSRDRTPEIAAQEGARVIPQRKPGYAAGLIEGLESCRGRYVLTMDADLSHPAEYAENLWVRRSAGDVVIASRFVPGARFEAPLLRKVLSWLLNRLTSKIFSLPIHDLSSGYRLYRRETLEGLDLESVNYEILEEILIKITMRGWKVVEAPFHYAPRRHGQSKTRLLRFGWAILKTLWRLRAVRKAAPSQTPRP